MDYQFNIRKAYSLLFPTGRAWQYTRGSENTEGNKTIFVDGAGNKFADGVGQVFGYSESVFFATKGKMFINAKLKAYDRAYADSKSISNSILPDNSDFDETDAERWERTLLISSNLTDLEERKQRIARQLFYPNGVVERQHYTFIEEQLQAAGFNVFIIENRFWNGTEFEVQDPDAIATKNAELGLGELGELELGGEIQGIDYTSIIANSIYENVDNYFFLSPVTTPPGLGEVESGDVQLGGQTSIFLPREIQLQGSFFLGGNSYPSYATVPIERKEELRQLVLKLKPAHTLCFEYINYI